MSKTKLSDSEQVSAHIAKLEAPFAAIIEELRHVVLATDPSIAEHIKVEFSGLSLHR